MSHLVTVLTEQRTPQRKYSISRLDATTFDGSRIRYADLNLAFPLSKITALGLYINSVLATDFHLPRLP